MIQAVQLAADEGRLLSVRLRVLLDAPDTFDRSYAESWREALARGTSDG
jgi:hypothetical protein